MEALHPLSLPDVLKAHFLGQTVPAWCAFLAIWIVVYLLLRFPKTLIARKLSEFAERTHQEIWSLAADLIRRINPIFLLVIGLHVASFALALSPHARWNINVALIVAFIFQAALWMDQTAGYTIARLLHARLGGEAAVTSTIDALKFFARLAIWSLAILLVLSNLQVNITTLIAGLGVGGVAIALAVNQILGDFFASMAILLDKPFDVGDFIMFDTFSGTVEHIGFKTTRVRSATGEQLVVGNAGLLQSRIRNFRRLQERRVLFVVSIKDDAPGEKLAQIPAMLEETIGAVANVRFERAHLKEYAGSTFNYEVVYWVQDQNLLTYMETHQKVTLELVDRLRAAQISLAAITQPPI
jgi:small-conductance mechanosensitive channel